MTKRSIGEFMALLRKAAGYTQQEVAEKLNVSNRTLSSWETDRTVPDVLMLPVIAELYGVTVDELLRGERNQSDEPAQVEFTEKSQRSMRKLQFAKFSLRNVCLTSFSCVGALLFILAACLNLFSGSPAWLDALIGALGGCGVIACTILQIYFYYKAKYGGGIVLSEDLTDDKKSYALALKRKFALYFLISAIPFLLFTVILGGIYCDVQPNNSYISYNDHYLKVTIIYYLRKRYFVFMFICLAAGLAMLATYFVCSNAGLKNVMAETQLQAHKYNLKLACILCGCSAVPVIVMFIVFLCCGTSYGYSDVNGNWRHSDLLLFYVLFILAAVVSSAVSGIIYAVKRKRQNCSF